MQSQLQLLFYTLLFSSFFCLIVFDKYFPHHFSRMFVLMLTWLKTIRVHYFAFFLTWFQLSTQGFFQKQVFEKKIQKFYWTFQQLLLFWSRRELLTFKISKKIGSVFVSISLPSSVSIKLVLLCEEVRFFSQETFTNFWIFYQRNCPFTFAKTITFH